jgi:hypothetical protein
MPDQGRDVGIGYPRQALARRPAGRDGGQAPLDVAVVSSEMRCGQSIEQRAMRGIEIAQSDKMVRERPDLVPGPGVERGEQCRLVDQAGLQGEQAEEEMAVGGDGGHEESPFRETAPDRAGHDGGAQAGEIALLVLSHEAPRHPYAPGRFQCPRAERVFSGGSSMPEPTLIAERF